MRVAEANLVRDTAHKVIDAAQKAARIDRAERPEEFAATAKEALSGAMEIVVVMLAELQNIKPVEPRNIVPRMPRRRALATA